MKNLLVVISCVLSSFSLAEARPVRATLVNSNELTKMKEFDPNLAGPFSRQRISGDRPLCNAFEAGCLIVTYQEGSDILNPTRMGEQVLLPLDPSARQELVQSEAGEVSLAFKEWQSDRISTDALRKTILSHPSVFNYLTVGYKSLVAQNVPRQKLQKYEQIISQALLLTIDALYSSADFNLISYPFNDRLASPDTLLDINNLYRKLSVARAWPQFVGLSEDVRKDRGDEYVQKDKFGNYVISAVYDRAPNTLYMDYSLSFYDNVYTLYHELWHVAYNFSPYIPQSVEKVFTALKGDQAGLRRELIRQVNIDEVSAIDQACRFFHATQVLTAQWGGPESAPSARGWTLQCLGPRAFNGAKSFERRVSPNKLSFNEIMFGKMTTGNLFGVVPPQGQDLSVLDPVYVKDITSRFARFYSKKYLNSATDIAQEDFIQLGKDISKTPLYTPTLATLTCEQVDTIIEALGESYGSVPFAYETPPGDYCSAPTSWVAGRDGTETIREGKDGSHTIIRYGKDGSHTVIRYGKDGSHTEVRYGKDGSHTEVRYGKDGSHTVIRYGKDGSHTEVRYGKDGSHTLIRYGKDGSHTEVRFGKDGSHPSIRNGKDGSHTEIISIPSFSGDDR